MKKALTGFALGLMVMAGTAFAGDGDGIIIGSGGRQAPTCTANTGTRDIVSETLTGILVSDFTGILVSDFVGIVVSD